MSESAFLLASLNDLDATFTLATVADLTEAGKVNLSLGEDVILADVPCSSSYNNRAVGDVVIVINAQSGKVVIGALNKPEAIYVTRDVLDQLEDDITDKVDETRTYATSVRTYAQTLNTKINNVDAGVPTILFGTSAPAGFLQADTVWFKDQGSGHVDIALVRAVDPGTPTPKPPPPDDDPPDAPATTPKPVTLSPAWRGSWRTNGQTDDAVWQGDWTGRGNWLGGWGFESRISNASKGHNVASMTFKISRTNDGSGWNRGVTANLHLFTRSSKGKPTPTGSEVEVSLSPGATKTITLPSSWTKALAAGTARGIMASGSGRNAYIKFSGTSGPLKITFNRDS